MSINYETYQKPATQGQVASLALKCSRLAVQVSRLADQMGGSPDKAVTAEISRDLMDLFKEFDSTFNTLAGWSDEG